MKHNSNDKTLLLSPFTPISKNIASHRAAQGIIYTDQLKQSGIDDTLCCAMICNISCSIGVVLLTYSVD